MKVLGIEFAPLYVPLERRLQTLAASLWFFTLAFGNIYPNVVLVYVIFFTRFTYVALAYLVWIWYDRDISRRGGRRFSWVRSWVWWEYFRDYFPLRLVKTVDLDPGRNYLFCAFPHGILSSGVFGHFGTEVTGFSDQFPGITPHVLTLDIHFATPGFREFVMAMGSCSASAESINYLLGAPGTGRAAVLLVGGAAEALKCRPGTYSLVLRRRKGFIRLALKHGTPLVPVFSFGETDVYDQVANPEGSWVRSIQKMVQKVTGMAPVMPIGRGFFQYSIGITPRRKPVTTVVGRPLEIKKIPDPTPEQIDEVHQKFIDNLIALFDENKVKYLKNSENISLVIE